MRRSPFPGMDPYLERYWQSFHSRFINYLADELNSGSLPSDLRADLEERVVIQWPHAEPFSAYPDVYVHELSRAPGGAVTLEARMPLTAIEPIIVAQASEGPRQRRVVISDHSGENVVTVIELLSPANKLPGRDRHQYLRKRERFLEGFVSVVEIDLNRLGDRTEATINDAFAFHPPTPYLAAVFRAGDSREIAVSPLPLREPLGAIRIPLRGGEPDAIVALQPLLETVQDKGRYPIDYETPLKPALDAADAAWAAERIAAWKAELASSRGIR